MKINYFLKYVFLYCISNSVFAQESTPAGAKYFDRSVPEKSDREFQFIALSYSQFVNNNLRVTQPFFQGQVLGRLFGGNTTDTYQGRSAYFEQRLLPFFIYRPKLMNGRVTLRASFEIDYTWGDASYGAAGNQGSAPGADQVNIQTQNVMIEANPYKGWFVNLGLQRMFDNPNNAYKVLFDELMNTGYRLAYWGSDGVGIQLRKEWDYSRFYAGYYQLYENNIDTEDDVFLSKIGYEKDITKTWKQGISVWHLSDKANGQGGSIGQGPGSAITELNGTYRFNIGGTRYDADIFWIGTTLNRNYGFTYDRLFMTGFFNYNIGNIRTKADSKKIYDIGGYAANIRMGYKYGQTNEDMIVADMIYASGDKDHGDNSFTGVVTGNTWGTPLSLFIGHGSYLLFPHGNVVNRFVAAVNDPSNAGYGLRGGTINFHKAFIPHKLIGKAGAAFSYSDTQPMNGKGQLIGTELNAMIRYTPKVYMDIEIHGGYLWLGDFYDNTLVNGNKQVRPVDPWTIFMVYRWLMF
jgi:hypothetical protein